MTATLEQPRVLHAVGGRLRVHLPGWTGAAPAALQRRVREIDGVRDAQARPATANVVVRFDERDTDADRIVDALARLRLPGEDEPDDGTHGPAEPPRALRQGPRRARITVRGLDRDPQVGRRVVERLHARDDVRRAVANPITGRVLVEFSRNVEDLHDVISDVSDVELPDLPGEDRPAHPLDPAPLYQSGARLIGSVLGLGLLAARRVTGTTAPPVASGAAEVSALLGVVEGAPPVRASIMRTLGPDRGELLLSGLGIVSLSLAGSPLGLAVSGAAALRLVTEVRARRAAWRAYEERLERDAPAQPGEAVRLDSGARVPLTGRVVEGSGTAIGDDGLPASLAPGGAVSAGMRVFGGPFVVQLLGEEGFTPEPRPAPARLGLCERYAEVVAPASLAYAVATGLLTRSAGRTLAALQLLNARPALIGERAADVGAAARVLRAGVTVVGTRPGRVVRAPDTLVLDRPRVLTDGFELAGLVALDHDREVADLSAVAAGVAAASGSPWGGAFRAAARSEAVEGSFDGVTARARVGATTYRLVTVTDDLAEAAGRRDRGEHVLALCREDDGHLLALVALRPRLAVGVQALVDACRRRGVALVVVDAGSRRAARAIAGRSGVELVIEADPVEVVRSRQRHGERVAVVSDAAHAAELFAACDLAIGLSSGRSSRFPARADLLAPDLSAVAAVVEAGGRRDEAVRDGVGVSVLANIAGVVWGVRGAPGIVVASRATYVAALGALASAWARLRGGRRSRSVAARLVDPQPERWGRQTPAATLRTLGSSDRGLTASEAAERRRILPAAAPRHPLLRALAEQARSPLTGLLAAGAGLSLLLGDPADAAIIGAVVVANAIVGAWQERQAGKVSDALRRLGAATARVVRDGQVEEINARDVVPGDVILLAAGDRVPGDARLLEAEALEVDEAALTGESLPVAKSADSGPESARVVLDGSDVTVGTGRAVVLAVGPQTRMGATAAALALDEPVDSPLGQRLNRMLHQSLPIIVGGGALVTVGGVLHGAALPAQLALGSAVAVAAVPEGLPLLAGVAQAAAARRLARRGALVRRLAAVEALGRVDVACCDKTGTLTQGRLSVGLVADGERAGAAPEDAEGLARDALRAAALASPRPDGPDAAAHPTDAAVLDAAARGGLDSELHAERDEESPFDPAHAFHATRVDGTLYVKGAPEVVAARCVAVRRPHGDERLDDAGRSRLLERAEHLSRQGMRVLMVAERHGGATNDPRELVALGFLGLDDPLRPGVRDAVERCLAAGIRLLMLTGDHPATARAIATEAGVPVAGVLTGMDIAELENGELDAALERATVIARITPLDKLRIVESLQRRGHVVAMTGDGVNDAPALRLADVGVAMGRHGTDVARQAADVVLADDEFATLVDTLVEGRGFWRNIRAALGLLLGGNLGELGLFAGASLAGLGAPLTTRQILVVNLVTDVLPAVAIAVQPPQHQDLTALAREGEAALDTPLRREVLRRGAVTAVPSLLAYGAARALVPGAAATVAFAGIVATQLAQTLQLGRSDGVLTRSVARAVGGSAALLVAGVTLPPLRAALGLASPGSVGWLLVAGAAAGAAWLSPGGMAGRRGILPALTGSPAAVLLQRPAA